MTPLALARFAAMDTARQVAILRQSSALDSDAADAIFGHLVGNHPDRYAALIAALDREEL